tara:strand:- start:986 stop:1561 length:576 start_codon:yes stop_codon:yes gene_type:complete
MEDKEFENAKKILNNKKPPTSEDILNLFFSEAEGITVINEKEFNSFEFQKLGDADDIKTITGTEWVASRLLWDTPEGSICSINLIKITKLNDKDPFEIMNGIYSGKHIYPYGNEIIDIDYENIIPLPFKEQLSLAIEVEDFEEATRLRDWDIGLKELLLEVKPKILKAIKKNDVKKLDDILMQIRIYRETL